MADTAAHLVDRVFPQVPVRQWVLTLPFALRYRVVHDPSMLTAVYGIFARTVFSFLRKMARDYGIDQTQCGAVSFVQRFGGSLNLAPHIHMLAIDGVYAPDVDGRPERQRVAKRGAIAIVREEMGGDSRVPNPSLQRVRRRARQQEGINLAETRRLAGSR